MRAARKMWLLTITCSALIVISQANNSSDLNNIQNEPDSELLLVHVLFSNGAVVPPPFPGDIYANKPSYPYEYGDLTAEGELTSFQLGKLLRQRYDAFLGDVFTTNLTQAYTTRFAHAQSSLQCLQAGLFPPKDEQQFDSDLDWQPTPYIVSKGFLNRYLSPLEFCNRTDWMLPPDENFTQLYKNLTEYTGNAIETNEQVYKMYKRLKYEEINQLLQHDWLKGEVIHEILVSTAGFYRQLLKDRTEIVIKDFLILLLQLSVQKSNDGLTPLNIKMFLFGFEETTIFLLLNALLDVKEFEQNHLAILPGNSACILIELHRVNNEIAFKLLYHKGHKSRFEDSNESNDFEPVEMQDCAGGFCTVVNFMTKIMPILSKETSCF